MFGTVTLPDTGVDLSAYQQAMVQLISRTIATVIGAIFAFMVIRAATRWVREDFEPTPEDYGYTRAEARYDDGAADEGHRKAAAEETGGDYEAVYGPGFRT